jgi:sugar phosphate isomerase/epimerase
MLHTGLVSITFRKLTPARIIELVVQAGLEGIEWGGDVHVPHGDLAIARQVRKMTEAAGLKVAAYGSYYRAGILLNEGIPFESVIETAVELGAPVIRVWAGNKGSAAMAAPERLAVVTALKTMGAQAARAGKWVALEYHAQTLTDTNESALDLMREVNHPNVRLYWQPYAREAFDYCLEGLKACLPLVTHIHIFSWQYAGEVIQRLPLADGDVRWAEYLKVIRSSGRDHFVMIEFVKDDREAQFLADAAALKSWVDAAVGG